VLLGDDEDAGDISLEPLPDSYEYWSKLRDSQTRNEKSKKNRPGGQTERKDQSQKMSRQIMNVSGLWVEAWCR
jgi:hypothetical protein